MQRRPPGRPAYSSARRRFPACPQIDDHAVAFGGRSRSWASKGRGRAQGLPTGALVAHGVGHERSKRRAWPQGAGSAQMLDQWALDPLAQRQRPHALRRTLPVCAGHPKPTQPQATAYARRPLRATTVRHSQLHKPRPSHSRTDQRPQHIAHPKMSPLAWGLTRPRLAGYGAVRKPRQ